ncbi:cytochrome C [Colwellia sp. MSW7]|uniref:Cytochrome C n=1 Tax=Colwellia maritima TaxID=2912588 RepID=A0ABS9X1Y1_9GAMM|nr:cytochrome C [Colwellia maritima]MCI2284224.1 cytochrome C [Colwellia maritima]
MNIKLLVVTLFAILTLFACNQGVDSPQGFSLPKGNIVKGEAAFMKYQCLACHSLENYSVNRDDYELITKEFKQPIPLGGTSAVVTTYAQLVTSIINPSHKIAKKANLSEEVTNEDGSSKMRIYNDVMTVSELIDLVAFLQPKYKIKPPTYTQYNRY